MKNYSVELILEPRLPKGKYCGRRYINISITAENESEAGIIAKEMVGVLLIPNVLIIAKQVSEKILSREY